MNEELDRALETLDLAYLAWREGRGSERAVAHAAGLVGEIRAAATRTPPQHPVLAAMDADHWPLGKIDAAMEAAAGWEIEHGRQRPDVTKCGKCGHDLSGHSWIMGCTRSNEAGTIACSCLQRGPKDQEVR